MKRIEYRVQFTGAVEQGRGKFVTNRAYHPEDELVRVTARDINSGFAKALKLANEPLGNGVRREIGGIEFSQVL